MRSWTGPVPMETCPRCSEAHAEFLQRNFANERKHERELDRRRREALRIERERAEELCHQQFLAEQQWCAQREAAARAPRVLPHQLVAMPPHRRIAQAGPGGTLRAAAEMVSGLRVLPHVARDTMVGAMRE